MQVTFYNDYTLTYLEDGEIKATSIAVVGANLPLINFQKIIWTMEDGSTVDSSVTPRVLAAKKLQLYYGEDVSVNELVKVDAASCIVSAVAAHLRKEHPNSEFAMYSVASQETACRAAILCADVVPVTVVLNQVGAISAHSVYVRADSPQDLTKTVYVTSSEETVSPNTLMFNGTVIETLAPYFQVPFIQNNRICTP